MVKEMPQCSRCFGTNWIDLGLATLKTDGKLSESIMPDNEKKFLKSYGYQVKDEFVSGDYEFYIMFYRWAPHFFQIAMQKRGLNFSDVNQQDKKIPSSLGKININSVKEKITQWLQKYNKIYIGSDDERKTEAWKKILTRLGD